MLSSQLSGFRFLPDSSEKVRVSTMERPILRSLTYADDILVFLSSPSELPTLFSIISIFKHQLKRFFEDLIEHYQQLELILSQRNFSILGRGLVANSLILNRIWRAIRVLSPPQTFFSQVRSIAIKFLAWKSFPPVKFSICQRPKKEVGLAVLDPAVQHTTLQLRWLHPLLSPSIYPERSTNFALSILRYCIKELSQSPHHLLPFVFPERRSSSMRTLGYLPSLLKTFDKLGVQINWDSFNRGVFEELPLIRVCSSIDTTINFNSYANLVFSVAGRPPETDSQLILFQRSNPVFNSLFLPELYDGTFLDSITNKWFHFLYLDPLDSLPDDYPLFPTDCGQPSGKLLFLIKLGTYFGGYITTSCLPNHVFIGSFLLISLILRVFFVARMMKMTNTFFGLARPNNQFGPP
ncbi:hypothetical protein G6F33_009458 [Rhizopus arrhizus]|nr:hypothetical protein G6F23_001438 [Rhizopus arrhizus]KAG0761628.1 hypothetical protein G6F24_007418 [Rhizopus arrhizus]KAG0908693.1 hypothetical protein G6F33_009458 [Rhizopus arrhizus]KAG0943788.1 hypothetical protein G6F32_007557 [Rhizopus arrhizus]